MIREPRLLLLAVPLVLIIGFFVFGQSSQPTTARGQLVRVGTLALKGKTGEACKNMTVQGQADVVKALSGALVAGALPAANCDKALDRARLIARLSGGESSGSSESGWKDIATAAVETNVTSTASTLTVTLPLGVVQTTWILQKSIWMLNNVKTVPIQ